MGRFSSKFNDLFGRCKIFHGIRGVLGDFVKMVGWVMATDPRNLENVGQVSLEIPRFCLVGARCPRNSWYF